MTSHTADLRYCFPYVLAISRYRAEEWTFHWWNFCCDGNGRQNRATSHGDSTTPSSHPIRRTKIKFWNNVIKWFLFFHCRCDGGEVVSPASVSGARRERYWHGRQWQEFVCCAPVTASFPENHSGLDQVRDNFLSHLKIRAWARYEHCWLHSTSFPCTGESRGYVRVYASGVTRFQYTK